MRRIIGILLMLIAVSLPAYSQELVEQPFVTSDAIPKLDLPTGKLIEQPMIIGNTEPAWTGPTSYAQILQLVQSTGNLALIVWYSDECPWCDKLMNETLSYYVPALQQHYIVYYANARTEPQSYANFAKGAKTYYYPQGERWDGGSVPAFFIIGPWNRVGQIVVYGCGVGYMDKQEFVNWHNAVVTKWGLNGGSPPDYYRGSRPPQSQSR